MKTARITAHFLFLVESLLPMWQRSGIILSDRCGRVPAESRSLVTLRMAIKPIDGTDCLSRVTQKYCRISAMEVLIPILIMVCALALLFPVFPDIFTKFGDWFASEKTPLPIHTAYILILIFLPLAIVVAVVYIQS